MTLTSKVKMERTRDYLLHCLWIIILCAAVGAAATGELYVKPSSTAACPSSNCYTLDHILQNPSQYLISNLTIFFLADIYEISTQGQVVVTNVNNLAFVGKCQKRSAAQQDSMHKELWIGVYERHKCQHIPTEH